MEDAEWLNEDEVETAGLTIPTDTRASGLPFVDKEVIDYPWE